MGSMRPGMPPMIPDFRQVEVPFKGREEMDYLEFLPKLAINYSTGAGDLYATVTRGYKAGGFNTQIFSDILQEKTKNTLMADAMSAMGRPSAPSEDGDASITTYDPEYSWNYEVGGHLEFADKRLRWDFAVFWIECRDQQLTVFPDGLTTGRMMSNAGRSRSKGFETTLEWRRRDAHRGLSVVGNYGYTHAKFVEFNDGVNDYAGNYLPYAPQHTASLSASYRFDVGGGFLRHIDLDASWQGAGKIYWNEANTLEQDFYSQLSASVTLHTRNVSLSLWGRNLTDTDFYTFYFKSMTNNFYNHGKPCRIGATLNFAF
jgi:outer membrane receptor protein involved in Fe transport